MALTDDIELHEMTDLVEYSADKRIRKKIVQSKGAVCELVCYEPGQETVLHQHPAQDEIFYIVEGSGLITFDGRDDIAVKPGSVVFIPAGNLHGIRANGTERLAVMFTKGPGVTGKAAKEFMDGG